MKNLLKQIKKDYDLLTKQQKLIAEFIMGERQHLAFMNLKAWAQACKVQPSAVVRFAQRFDYSGFAELLEVFKRAASIQNSPLEEYQQRIKNLNDRTIESSEQVALDFIQGCKVGLEIMMANLDESKLKESIEALYKAPKIWITGNRRAFGIGAYLVYSLEHLNKNVIWLSGIGGFDYMRLKGNDEDNLLVAIGFNPYAEETLRLVELAKERGVKILAISDNPLSPIVKFANIAIIIKEHSVFNFRSISNAMCVAQSIIVGLSYFSIKEIKE